jgi:hypothetical protein
VAEVLSRILGTPITSPDTSLQEALDAGMPETGAALERLNTAGQPARPEFAREFGPLTGFEEWAHRHMRPRSTRGAP